MRFKTILLTLLIALCALVAVPFAGAQDPDEDDVRGAFLTSRPKSADKPATPTTSKPVRRRPKTATTKVQSNAGGTTATNTNGGVTSSTKEARESKQRLGLGLTLFMRNSTGLAVRVDPNHEFTKGDMVRVLLETNADGYLYIFNTTDNGDPVMVYPHPKLDDGGNFIQAHVPFEIPSSLASEEHLRWLAFDSQAGTERLYFVFTREPLAGVPIEDELIKYCGESKSQCPWHPSAELWAGLQKEMASPSRSDNSHKFGKAQTQAEAEASTRGIGLAREDAEPSMVIMTASSGPSMLVAALELLHK